MMNCLFDRFSLYGILDDSFYKEIKESIISHLIDQKDLKIISNTTYRTNYIKKLNYIIKEIGQELTTFGDPKFLDRNVVYYNLYKFLIKNRGANYLSQVSSCLLGEKLEEIRYRESFNCKNQIMFLIHIN
jgi:hypothetical protein